MTECIVVLNVLVTIAPKQVMILSIQESLVSLVWDIPGSSLVSQDT